MAKGPSETFSRMRAVLVTTSGIFRPLDAALDDWTDKCRGKRFEIPASIGDAFVLERTGNAPDPGSLISEGAMTRYELLRCTLSKPMGAGEDGSQDYGQVQAAMSELSLRVQDVLEDPNNHLFSTTGWIDCDAWSHSVEETPRNGRLFGAITFRALVQKDMGAL